MSKLKNFLNHHVWPWTVFHKYDTTVLNLKKDLERSKAKVTNLQFDVEELVKAFTKSGIDVNGLRSDGFKPIKIAYATGNLKAVMSKPGDGKEGFVDIQYIYSEPQLIRLHEKFSRIPLSEESYEYFRSHFRQIIAHYVIEDIEDLAIDTAIEKRTEPDE